MRCLGCGAGVTRFGRMFCCYIEFSIVFSRDRQEFRIRRYVFIIFTVLFRIGRCTFSMQWGPRDGATARGTTILLISIKYRERKCKCLGYKATKMMPFNTFCGVIEQLHHLQTRGFLSIQFSRCTPYVRHAPPSHS